MPQSPRPPPWARPGTPIGPAACPRCSTSRPPGTSTPLQPPSPPESPLRPTRRPSASRRTASTWRCPTSPSSPPTSPASSCGPGSSASTPPPGTPAPSAEMSPPSGGSGTGSATPSTRPRPCAWTATYAASRWPPSTRISPPPPGPPPACWPRSPPYSPGCGQGDSGNRRAGPGSPHGPSPVNQIATACRSRRRPPALPVQRHHEGSAGETAVSPNTVSVLTAGRSRARVRRRRGLSPTPAATRLPARMRRGGSASTKG
jgi:hypothetical protein